MVWFAVRGPREIVPARAFTAALKSIASADMVIFAAVTGELVSTDPLETDSEPGRSRLLPPLMAKDAERPVVTAKLENVVAMRGAVTVTSPVLASPTASVVADTIARSAGVMPSAPPGFVPRSTGLPAVNGARLTVFPALRP